MLSTSPSQVPLLIGCGAGFSGDRWDAAVPVVRTLIARGGPAVLMFETLAERTLALAQLQRRQNPQAGYEPTLARFIRPVLADCIAHGIPIVGNFGAAHPHGAAACLQALAQTLGLPPLRIGVVEGDDVLAQLTPEQLAQVRGPHPGAPVSANAYLGAQGIAACLRAGAQIVVTGRVADPALALGPMLAHFGWAEDDWDRLAAGTIAGHLLECGAQVCGGYFADPGLKDVPDLAHVGFPVLSMAADGRFTVGKADHTGGCVDERTVKEQLLYEIHDPAAYLTPDVVADISAVQVQAIGPNQVQVSGVRGHPRPATLKTTACFEGGWLAEGEISYAGPNAVARARLAAEVVRTRLAEQAPALAPLRCDLIGVASLFNDDASDWARAQGAEAATDPLALTDVRLRVAARSPQREDAEQLTREVLALYTCGPAGGAGVRTAITPRLASESWYVPRAWIQERWSLL
ncbi:DUF1446 domain-containing protein [Curvibacter sp. HBC61]|uniref:DUF1446 domain-containing protein n=1 Tax=Curvibacter cyanobacteriorum TaxID=3026422 RepID=A0ABT5MXX1_9BURK|nr:acyclic terpene utilization AtuA family protein [Curvibacter sp. HBC61]MDD0838890.1 DUF1446 domain-containing protein [Curvibacter sp. HBC61]